MAASIDGLVQDLDAFNRAFNEALDCWVTQI
jgi:hypothetical protein